MSESTRIGSGRAPARPTPRGTEGRPAARVPQHGVEPSAERVDAEGRVRRELETWRAVAVPDASASFDADALAHLVRRCLAALGIEDAGASFSVNTVHYYRRKNILDEPAGRTSAARYDLRHLWQSVGARLAGHLGLVTLAEARDAMRGADEVTLVSFVAARVVDARARAQLRETSVSAVPTTIGRVLEDPPAIEARPLPGALAASARRGGAERTPSVVIPLPGEAWCIVPASHAAHHSPDSAREVVHALATALRVPLR